VLQTFLWKADAVVDMYKNAVESERVRGPSFTHCGMGFVPFVCRFKADPASSLILGKFSSLLDATWMDGKNGLDVCGRRQSL
jgi:hypothetical protein